MIICPLIFASLLVIDALLKSLSIHFIVVAVQEKSELSSYQSQSVNSSGCQLTGDCDIVEEIA